MMYFPRNKEYFTSLREMEDKRPIKPTSLEEKLNFPRQKVVSLKNKFTSSSNTIVEDKPAFPRERVTNMGNLGDL